MRQERQPTDILLWTKVLSHVAIFKNISPRKLGILIVLCCCILQSQTSCLYKASSKISSVLGVFLPKSIDYQCFIKFFCTGKGDLIQKAICQLLIYFLFSTCATCQLVLDRTNWEYGKSSKNILCIGAIYYGCFIPLVWVDLNKKGNSTMKVRLELIERLQKQWLEILPFPVLYLSGDREFIGDFWLRELVRLNIQFVVRVKTNMLCQVWFHNKVKERAVKIKVLHRYMSKKGLKSLEIVLAGDYVAHLIVLENTSNQPDEPFLYLLTNIDDADKAAQLYRMRWKIECCFKHLKTNGFNLESQAFTAPHKIELLMSIIVLVYAMAVYEGIIVFKTQEIKYKNYKNTDKNGEIAISAYPEISVFRAGLAIIEFKIQKVQQCIQYLINIIDKYNIQNQTIT